MSEEQKKEKLAEMALVNICLGKVGAMLDRIRDRLKELGVGTVVVEPEDPPRGQPRPQPRPIDEATEEALKLLEEWKARAGAILKRYGR